MLFMALTRYLFASDLHASDLAFRKFISVALQYKVNVAVTDELTGKFIIPALKMKDGSTQFQFRDETVVARTGFLGPRWLFVRPKLVPLSASHPTSAPLALVRLSFFSSRPTA
jgi:hypothetical protein